MLKKIQKLPLHKRKMILWTVTGIMGLLLLSLQIFITSKRFQDPAFTLFPRDKVEKFTDGARERSTDIGKIYQSTKEEIKEKTEIDEKEIIRILKKEGVIEEGELEEIFQEKGIEKEDIEREELFKIIEEELIKEKNDGKEKQQ